MSKVLMVIVNISQYPPSNSHTLLCQLSSQQSSTCPSLSKVSHWSLNNSYLFFPQIYSLLSLLHAYRNHFSKYNRKFLSPTERLMPNGLWHSPLHIPPVVSTHLIIFAILFSVLKYFMFLSLDLLPRFFCRWIQSSTFYKTRTMLVMQKYSFIILKEIRVKWEKESL